jgi:hypothetical protein
VGAGIGGGGLLEDRLEGVEAALDTAVRSIIPGQASSP